MTLEQRAKKMMEDLSAAMSCSDIAMSEFFLMHLRAVNDEACLLTLGASAANVIEAARHYRSAKAERHQEALMLQGLLEAVDVYEKSLK